MNNILNLTRAIIEAAISLHMLVLKLLAGIETFKTNRADKQVATAHAVLTAQQARVSAARADLRQTRNARIAAHTNRSNAFAGFKAEASRLSRTFSAA